MERRCSSVTFTATSAFSPEVQLRTSSGREGIIVEEVVARVLQLFVALAGAYALALWFALIVWTYRDITARSTNPVTHIFSTLVVVLFWVPGAILYLLLRPRESLDEAFQRTMEEEYLLQDLDEFPVCPSCRRSVRDDFLFCPHCSTELRGSCVACHRLVDLRWDVCPYCGATQFEPAPAVPVTSESRSRSSRQSSGASNLQPIDGGRARATAVRERDEPHDAPTSVNPVLLGAEEDAEAAGGSSKRRAKPRAARDQG